jgi:hypothetical protein
MISKPTEDALYLIEMDEKCGSPIAAHQEFLHLDLDFPEPKYFRWHLSYRNDDPQQVEVEVGQGTLSPMQNTALLLHRASEVAGGAVKLLPKYHYCPVLIGRDGNAVPLYEFVEALDASTDYDKIETELPNLTYAQIHGSLMFLRKVAQFNIGDIDIDALEDEQLFNDEVFVDELKRAFADREKLRVLSFDKPDNR